MSDEQRKNLLVRNKADHFPNYTYAGDGWIDGRGEEIAGGWCSHER